MRPSNFPKRAADLLSNAVAVPAVGNTSTTLAPGIYREPGQLGHDRTFLRNRLCLQAAALQWRFPATALVMFSQVCRGPLCSRQGGLCPDEQTHGDADCVTVRYSLTQAQEGA